MPAPKSSYIRLEPQGTRVFIIPRNSPGVISEVRTQPHLKTYVVRCDDGSVHYASACDLAREDDTARTPLGPPREY